MTHSLPQFPPLFPIGRWWRLFLSRRLEGFSRDDAVAAANKESAIRPRDWMRMALAQNTRISLPVRGGASALKNHHPETWYMAQEVVHENRKVVATVATVYGQMPYSRFLSDVCIPVKPGAEGMVKASEVCLQAFERVVSLLELDDDYLLDQLRDKTLSPTPSFKCICNDFNKNFNPELSIVDALMRLGKDAIFVLVPSF